MRAAPVDTAAVPPRPLDLVRSIYAEWQRGDFTSDAWAAPDIDFETVGGPVPGRWTGVREMGAAWGDFLRNWKDVRVARVDEYRTLDDERVLVLLRFTGRGRSSGLDIRDLWPQAASIFTIRDGKVTRLAIYLDAAAALADSGLPAEP
jgi:ketosteroid isomerase-like protein